MKRIFAALAVTTFVIVGAPQTAQAVDPNYCPSGYACFWEDAQFATDGHEDYEIKFYYKIYAFDSFCYYYDWWSCVDGGENATSIYNNGNYYATRWFLGEYFVDDTGGIYMPINGGDNDLSNTNGVNPYYNNKFDSACFVSESNCYAH